MLVSELMLKLAEYPQDIEVRVLNSSIDLGESSPTFEIQSVDGAESEEEGQIVLIEMESPEYIKKRFLIK